MRIDLVENSEQYDAFSYPGGERQVRLTGETVDKLNNLATHRPAEVDLVARIKSTQDIIDLALLKDAIQNVHHSLGIHLWVPYLPYGRADRKFVDGDCFGLSVFGNLINAMDFDSVITLDPHSLTAIDCIHRLQILDPVQYIEKAIIDFASKAPLGQINVLYPDEGAAKRYQIRSNLGCNTKNVEVEFFYATKKRDAATGKFLGFTVPEMPDRHTLIVDDICDGGGTFIGIAQALRGKITASLALYVTHGIFSKGLTPILEYFDKVYCTDSFGPVQITDPDYSRYFVQYPIKINHI